MSSSTFACIREAAQAAGVRQGDVRADKTCHSVQALAASADVKVTFLAVTRLYQQCQQGVQAQTNAASAIQYKCLAPEHFVPAVSASYTMARMHAHLRACMSISLSKILLQSSSYICHSHGAMPWRQAG